MPMSLPRDLEVGGDTLSFGNGTCNFSRKTIKMTSKLLSKQCGHSGESSQFQIAATTRYFFI